jgi:O-Methyltransferase involved in polyketide biosynthesis
VSNFQGVANTLFIPLEARIFVSKKFPEYFYDEKALSLAQHITNDSIRKKSSEYSFMASVARYYNIDSMTEDFLGKHKHCNIIYLGAGLETAYHRLNGADMLDVRFFEVDLPEVIDVRRALLGTGTNEVLIGGDMFDFCWKKGIDSTLPSLLIATGVFQYFSEEKVVRFIKESRNVFTHAELIFDATNETGLAYTNKYVKKTGNDDALMHFYINNSALFSKTIDATLIEEQLFFQNARKMLGRRLKLYTRIAMKVVDKGKRAILVHLLIN